MRPIRLELEGFTAFREHVSIDFAAADLFSLTGPTGSGKSSVIDAIVFCLYGSVPRYDDRRLVAPVITQGRVEARVRFDFTVGGEPFTAVRVVRRTDQGATTKEAGLWRGDEVLADSAPGLTEAVESLLGLGFEHFTKCVVLPQGEFARFLHDPPRERQELLRRLLDLEAYRRMMERANRRAALAGDRAELLAERLGELAAVSPEAREGAVLRLEALRGLRKELEEARAALERWEGEVEEETGRAAELEASLTTLEGVEAPAGMEELSRRLAEAREGLEGAEREEAAARRRLEEAEEALGRLPDRAELELILELHRRREEKSEQAEAAARRLEGSRRREEEARAKAARAARAVVEAEQTLEDLRRRHAAHDLRQGLRPGDPCPVCGQAVGELADEVPVDLEEARRAFEGARQILGELEGSLRAAEAERVREEGRREGLEGELAELDGRLREQPARQEVEARLEEVAEAERRAAAVREEARAAGRRAEAARKGLAELAERERSAWSAYDAQRDRVASLSPPPARREDLAEDWRRLGEWARSSAEELRARRKEARRRAARAEEEAAGLRAKLVEAARALEVEVPEGRSVWDCCLEELTRAETEVDRIERALEETDRLRKEESERREEAQVARELARHLGAQGFEKWVMDEALATLVEGANRRLGELSVGRYSLALDHRGDFQAIDHLNADEERPAKTLSGGETFLASLSLALSLADRLAEMSAHGGARLESIFLDEGFGTLDPETLETVAAVIHELGASGRTVGLVTHVRELAELVPVRFEVRKGARTATVERVEGGAP